MAPWRIIAQYLGRSDGPTRGRDGNVHLGDVGLGTLTMVSHLPAMLPVAVGCALAFRVRNEPRVALGWFGDGGSARGDAHEAMNLAGVRRLPVVFVLDNNGFAYSTPSHLEYGVTHLAERAAAYGFPGQRRRRHRRRRGLPRRPGGDRARPRRRRTDAARARDAAHGGPRGARRRVLRAAGAARGLARARSRSRSLRARLLALGGSFDEAADEALLQRGRARGGRRGRARARQRVARSRRRSTDGVYR